MKLEAYHQSRQPNSFSLFPLMFWDFGSLHQGCVRRDGSDGWRSPVSRGDNTGVRHHLPPPPSIVSCPADRSRTSWWFVDGVRDGRLSTYRRVPFLGFVLGLRFALSEALRRGSVITHCISTDVAASLWPAVAAAAVYICEDVAASLVRAVAAAANAASATLRRQNVSAVAAQTAIPHLPSRERKHGPQPRFGQDRVR